MKTVTKFLLFATIFFGGMGGVRGQMPLEIYFDATREIAFLSDTGWVQGEWKKLTWMYPEYPAKSRFNYEQVGSIPGIEGDTVCMRLVDTGSYNVVSVYKWEFWNAQGGEWIDTTIYGDTASYVIKGFMQPFKILIYFEDKLDTPFHYSHISAKFANPTPSITPETEGGSKSLIMTSNDSITLSLNDFHVKFEPLYVGVFGHAYNNVINWYCNDTLKHTGTDTMWTFYSSGVYHVEIENKFIPDTTKNDYIYYRTRTSETLQVEITNTTGIADVSIKEEVKLSAYPNPTTNYLYLSSEVEYVVFSISGSKVLEGFGKEIDVTSLEYGVYLLSTPIGSLKFLVQ